MKREEEIRQYLKERNIPITSLEANSIIEGIEWADEHPTPCSVRMVGSQSYSKQQLREMGFAFDLNGNVLSPNHLAKKAAHYMIDKACEWIESAFVEICDMSKIPYNVSIYTRYRRKTDLINDFKKAMEEYL